MSDTTIAPAPFNAAEFAVAGVTFGEGPASVTVAPQDLPAVSVAYLFRKGFMHYFGNEAAARVSNAKKVAEETGTPLTDEQVIEARAEFQSAFLATLKAGTVGNRASGVATGPKATPLETVVNKMAAAEIGAKLAKVGLKLPTGDKVITVSGETRTRAQLLASYLAKHGERITADAKKSIKAEEARLAKVQGDDVSDLLG